MINSLPEKFIERLRTILPSEKFNQCIKTFSEKSETTFWINTLIADKDEVVTTLKTEKFSLTPISNFKNTFSIPYSERDRLIASQLYTEGKIYIQNLASMLPVMVLDPQPDENILDLTAAPGSKTIQMACMMNNQGHIAAVEKIKNRFFHLKANLAQHGITNTEIFLKDGSLVWKYRANHFDKVLIDAPCSSEARFSTDNPDSYHYWSEKKILDMSRKQKQLLYSAIQCAKPGGTIIYSTCSYAPEENELVVNQMLKKFTGKISLQPITIPVKNIQKGLTQWGNKKLNPELQNCLRVLPTKTMHEFFICKILKSI